MQAWRDHPTTRKVLEYLKDKREGILEEWALGMFTRPTMDETAQMNSHSIGMAEAINHMMKLNAQEIQAFYMKEDDESNTTGPEGPY